MRLEVLGTRWRERVCAPTITTNYYHTMEIMGMDRWDSFVEFLDDIKDEYYYKQVTDIQLACKSSAKHNRDALHVPTQRCG